MSDLIEHLEAALNAPSVIPGCIYVTPGLIKDAAARIRELEADRKRLLEDFDADLERAKRAMQWGIEAEYQADQIAELKRQRDKLAIRVQELEAENNRLFLKVDGLSAMLRGAEDR